MTKKVPPTVTVTLTKAHRDLLLKLIEKRMEEAEFDRAVVSDQELDALEDIETALNAAD